MYSGRLVENYNFSKEVVVEFVKEINFCYN